MNEESVALVLRGVVVLPGTLRAISVGRPPSVGALRHHMDSGTPLVLVPQRDAEEEDVAAAELSSVGVTGRVLRLAHVPDGTHRILVEGLERTRVQAVEIRDGVVFCRTADLPEPEDDPVAVGALAIELADRFREYMVGTGLHPTEHDVLVPDTSDPSRLADHAASQLDVPLVDRIALLEETSVTRRLTTLLEHITTALASQRIATDVQQKLQAAMDRSQREFHLREQLKAIRAELGDALGAEAEADRFEERVRDLEMPEEAREEALREVERMRRIHTDSAEYMISRTWLEMVCDFPWSTHTVDTTDLRRAQRVLDRDHHGLDKVKERILEYLAVRQLQPDSKGPILCFVGPPGVGKTSLGRSIATALGRSFGRIALGGIKDENEVRGHRRTYVGAMPGRIVRAIVRAKSRNPVLVLDELDKVGNDFRGDPASALLEVLDAEQNTAFVDHYLDLPVDLSQVLFIATANLVDPIPDALRDRLEIIELPGYAEEEKLEIARRFLLPKLATAHGLVDRQLTVTSPAIQKIIRDYTREAGLRELDRQLATVFRKVARRVVEEQPGRIRLTDKQVPKYLGPSRYYQELAERVDQPGVVIGLAWTPTGGDILFVEALKMTGQPSLKLTGSLGDVMKESAEAALSWLRAHADSLGLPQAAFDAALHLHVPAGAIPKDGPSAGVTMVTALASLLLGRPVRHQLAMTGEITLRGKVLPVGGVKEKVLAARRAGVRTILLPKHNASDLEDIPPALLADVTIAYMDTVDDVLRHALVAAAPTGSR
jgi:ATP-dependent Lon protease